MNPLNFPNMLLFMAAASSFGGRRREAFMSSGLVGRDLPGPPLERLVLPDMGDEAFEEDELSLKIGLGLKMEMKGVNLVGNYEKIERETRREGMTNSRYANEEEIQ